ncbi:SNF2 domain-containing family protein, partial [Striga asiatica]
AMDRAHRLGQRKVVNVHRLIMRGTLEEKVMSLQKFKVSVANAVINSDNASMNTMNTDQLLDLFTSADGKRPSLMAKTKSSGSRDFRVVNTTKVHPRSLWQLMNKAAPDVQKSPWSSVVEAFQDLQADEMVLGDGGYKKM